MSSQFYVLGAALAVFTATACAKGETASDASTVRDSGGDDDDDDGGGGDDDDDDDVVPDGGCGELCDSDGDGVLDPADQCAGTPDGEPVNAVGCSDSQTTPTLEPTFPPYGLDWNTAGDIGRPGGLTWTYTGIERADLFHIYWVVCDDPAVPCGVSLDGNVDEIGETWTFSNDSDLPTGRLVFTNSTQIILFDASTIQLIGRLTMTITDGVGAPIPFAEVGTLGVPPRDGTHGAEIMGTGFIVHAFIEVQQVGTVTWQAYLDYYDAQQTPDPGPGTAVSFGGSFYDE